MKRVTLLCAVVRLCLIVLGLGAEEQPLATRVEHFYLVSDQAQSLFTYFKDTFQLPEVWPFWQRGPFASGGLSLGNAVLEFVSFPKKDNELVKTEFRGIAFEPAADADATAVELTKRDIPHADARTYKFQVPGGEARVEWSSVGLKDFPPTNADVFFCDYKNREGVAQGRRAASGELAERMGGPLGVVGAAEITVGVHDLDDAREKWSILLAPAPQISEDAFVFKTGPRIRLVRADSPGIRGIVLTVRSIIQAEKFLRERQLLAKDDVGHTAISLAAIDGLSIRLVDAAQEREPGNPLLGRGLGVDHVGIAVRDLEKTINDCEPVLGFKCIRQLPKPTGVVSSVIYFENTSYLELLSAAKQPSGAKLSGRAQNHADFAEKHEGAIFLGLATSSAKGAADYLKAHNFEAFLSGEESVRKEGETKPPPPPWYFVAISHEPSGNKQAFPLAIFLIEYVSPGRLTWLASLREKEMLAHPNTARRIHSVWFAVRDLDASLRNIQNAGLEPGEMREAKFLGASGRDVWAGQGRLLLLRSSDDNGALNKFLSNHDDGEIIGVSIEVSDLNKARSWVEDHSGQKVEAYEGFYSRSILIPPDLTHKMWMEFFQR
ncbi:MAG: VOC family protein [Candidatus Aminicenantes bacterium]|nr:VOC family protein [Candidatus Aminicenantes bacterium]